MSNKLSNFVIFAVGAAIGSAVTWKFLKTKYEQIAQEEIESVKEVFSRREAEAEGSTKEPTLPRDIDEMHAVKDDRYEKALARYTSDLDPSKEKGGKKTVLPYVITPEEFGMLDDYDTVSLTYYDDEILTDDTDEPIEDIDDVVGEESLTCFGEYEDDSVFVRNDRLKTDYEILRDSRKYADVVGRSSYQSEEE